MGACRALVAPEKVCLRRVAQGRRSHSVSSQTKMSDKRRRKRLDSGDSEHSEGEESLEKDEGVDSAPEGGESEYESADDDIVPGLDGVRRRERKEKADAGSDGCGEEPYPGIDREEGDGEEDPEGEDGEEAVDDDEDERNPQYIPKRG